jgi:hypothetical protein
MGEYKAYTKEEKKRIVALFKESLLNDNEELFFKMLHVVLNDWYLKISNPVALAEALKEAGEGGN